MANRIATWDYEGKRYYLAYTGMAMFQIAELTGSVLAFSDKMTMDAGGADFILQAARIMSEAAEAQRKFLGYEPGNRLDAEYLAAFAAPQDILSLRGAVIEAYNRGLAREEQLDDAPLDLGLLEIQKKAAED